MCCLFLTRRESLCDQLLGDPESECRLVPSKLDSQVTVLKNASQYEGQITRILLDTISAPSKAYQTRPSHLLPLADALPFRHPGRCPNVHSVSILARVRFVPILHRLHHFSYSSTTPISSAVSFETISSRTPIAIVVDSYTPSLLVVSSNLSPSSTLRTNSDPDNVLPLSVLLKRLSSSSAEVDLDSLLEYVEGSTASEAYVLPRLKT